MPDLVMNESQDYKSNSIVEEVLRENEEMFREGMKDTMGIPLISFYVVDVNNEKLEFLDKFHDHRPRINFNPIEVEVNSKISYEVYFISENNMEVLQLTKGHKFSQAFVSPNYKYEESRGLLRARFIRDPIEGDFENFMTEFVEYLKTGSEPITINCIEISFNPKLKVNN